MRVFWPVFTMELRRIFSYRVDFWVQFFGAVTGEIGVAYFLWAAVYKSNQQEIIGGFTLPMMILYYVFASFAGRIIRGSEAMSMSSDIYEGSLTRYLLYPLDFIKFNMIQRAAYNVLTIFQMVIGLGILFMIFGQPAGFNFEISKFLMGVVTCVLASTLYFLIGSCLEMVSFWADNVWSLNVMFRFFVQFFSGIYIPLSLFPEWSIKYIYLSPFPYLATEPIKIFLGQTDVSKWMMVNLVIVLWMLPAMTILMVVWKRGLKQYTGVGI